VPRLATWLRAAGYDTAAFVAAFVLDRRFGLAEGFDVYDDRITRDPRAPDRLEAERAANEVADRAIAWLEARPPDAAKPFFLWVHFYDPHAPYRPPSGVSPGLNAYDAEVQYTDGQAGRVLDALGRRGDLERAVVVVAGDHGESLGDHGEQTHGMLLYDAALRVPVIVRGPGVPTAVSDAPIGLADLAPTILTLCAQAVPAALTGIDLFAVTPPPDREIYAETDYPRSAGWSPLSSLVTGRWKIIASSDTELFDLQQDPRELKNVGGSRQSTVAAMLERLSAVRSQPSEVERPSRASPEVEERLRALGYVSATTSSSRAQSGPNPARVIDGWVAFETILDRLRDGRAGDALPDARALAARFPDGQIFQATYARALQESGRYREALEAYRSTLARSEPRPALLHDLAVAARAGGDAAEAVKAERAAVALDPLYAVAHNGLGLALSDRRQWKEAEAAFAEASRLDPNQSCERTPRELRLLRSAVRVREGARHRPDERRRSQRPGNDSGRQGAGGESRDLVRAGAPGRSELCRSSPEPRHRLSTGWSCLRCSGGLSRRPRRAWGLRARARGRTRAAREAGAGPPMKTVVVHAL
jgi:arylsulfatase A-like enzyme